MDRRLFLIMAAAGVADPGSGSDPAPLPAATPVGPAPTASGDPNFDAWARGFFERSAAAGWPVELLNRELAGLTPDPRVSSLDGRQPEFSRPAGDYIRGAVSEARVRDGRARRAASPWLAGVETRYGVPAEVLVGIWGMESAYGAVQGDMDVIRSLATLAADGRRRQWAETQLLAALRLIRTGEVGRAQLRGSWAGAMGQTQFIPETFLTTAVDGDGDGRRDLWNSSQDALASAANLLAKAGWRAGESWQREVRLPAGFDHGLAEGDRRGPAAWRELGLTAADGAPFSDADQRSEAQLILPAGAPGPAFLVFPNHFVIRRYNNSTAYALGVGLLADQIAGRTPVQAAWPAETPLSLADRTGAQRALQALGFDPGAPDGVVGVNTRAAVRAWQRAKGLPADGHLTAELAKRLLAEAGLQAAAPAPSPVPGA